MTSSRFFGAFLALGVLTSCGGAGSGLDTAALPAEMQRPYALFSVRCSRCHSLARPLNARIDDMGHWRLYVRRMRSMPGSGINEADGRVILTFLEYYTHEVRGITRPEAEAAEDDPDAELDPAPSPDPRPPPAPPPAESAEAPHEQVSGD